MAITLTSTSTVNDRASAFEAAARPYYNAVRAMAAGALEAIPANLVSASGRSTDRNATIREGLMDHLLSGQSYQSLIPSIRAQVTQAEYERLTGPMQDVSVARANFVTQTANIARLYGYSNDEISGPLDNRTHSESPLHHIEEAARDSTRLQGAALDADYRNALRVSADQVDGFDGVLHNTFRDAQTLTLAGGYVVPAAAGQPAAPSTPAVVALEAGEGTPILAAAERAATTRGEYLTYLNSYIETFPAEPTTVREIARAAVEAYAAEYQAGGVPVVPNHILSASSATFDINKVTNATTASTAYRAALVAAGVSPEAAESARLNLQNGTTAAGVTPTTIDLSLNAVRPGFSSEVRAHLAPAAAAEADQTPVVDQTPTAPRPQRQAPNEELATFQALSFALGYNGRVGTAPNIDGIPGTATTAAIVAARAATPPIANFPATGNDYTLMNTALEAELQRRLTSPDPALRAPVLAALETIDARGERANGNLRGPEQKLVDTLAPAIARAQSIDATGTTNDILLRMGGPMPGELSAADLRGRGAAATIENILEANVVTPPPPPPAPGQEPLADAPPPPAPGQEPLADAPPAPPAPPTRTDGGQFRITLRGDMPSGKSFSVLDVASETTIRDGEYQYTVALPPALEAYVNQLAQDPRIGGRDNAERVASMLIAGKNGLNNADVDIAANQVLRLPTPEETERGVAAITAASQFAADGVSVSEARDGTNTQVVAAAIRTPAAPTR